MIIIVTKAKQLANQRWNQQHQQRRRYIKQRSAAKMFILKLATVADLELIQQYLETRQKELKYERKEH